MNAPYIEPQGGASLTGPQSVDQLEDLLSQPSEGAIANLARLDGDIIILGAGGKMGPTLARMARRASDASGSKRRILAVSRFSGAAQEQFERHGIETLRCDLLDESTVAALPLIPNVILMTGFKFGSASQAAMTWAMNTYLPSLICRHFARSRMIVFSTGNVYPLFPCDSAGPEETESLNPVGEYGMSAVGRERICEYFSREAGIRMSIVRLNYACELRYGVLVDIARRVFTGEPVPLAMGYLNTIWQGDANDIALRCFDHVATPPYVINVAGAETLSVRAIALDFGALLGRPVTFSGTEEDTALLSNCQKSQQTFGSPRVTIAQLVRWIADWVQNGRATLDKPTHFETRDGKF